MFVQDLKYLFMVVKGVNSECLQMGVKDEDILRDHVPEHLAEAPLVDLPPSVFVTMEKLLKKYNMNNHENWFLIKVPS